MGTSQNARLCKRISNEFMQRIENEKKSRDCDLYSGAFAETALIEHVYRYWLQSALGRLKFTDLVREHPYPASATFPDGSGVPCKRSSCDIHGSYKGKSYWIEIKVAYSNTGYTNSELHNDVEKLAVAPNGDGKMYVVVFVSETDEVPNKMSGVLARLDSVEAEWYSEKMPIDAPENWNKNGWVNCHIHLIVAMW